LHRWKAYEICYQMHYDTTQLTLGMLLRYLGKLKIQIFCITFWTQPRLPLAQRCREYGHIKG